jgi:hypothetical protein
MSKSALTWHMVVLVVELSVTNHVLVKLKLLGVSVTKEYHYLRMRHSRHNFRALNPFRWYSSHFINKIDHLIRLFRAFKFEKLSFLPHEKIKLCEHILNILLPKI